MEALQLKNKSCFFPGSTYNRLGSRRIWKDAPAQTLSFVANPKSNRKGFNDFNGLS